ncbi:MAG: DUF4230 domain-containing protein [Clostridia bacterium]|nr:DUF4230 domain-containing protein [Clostridia bacterium]
MSQEEMRPRRRRFPRPLRFLTRIVSTALVLSLTLVFLPHLTRLIGRLWPDPARTERVSEILRHKLSDSARLETLTVDDQGVLTSTVQAALIGEVQRVTIQYDYHASIGFDLTKAAVSAEGGVLTLTLPPLEILSDSLTPTDIDRQDFWYPLTEKRRMQLLEEERSQRAQAALSEVSAEESWNRATGTLENLIRSWIGPETWLVTLRFEKASNALSAADSSAASP